MINKRILITGLTGFVGRSIVSCFSEFGERFGFNCQLVGVGEEYDLLRYESVLRLCELSRPDWVLHLAGQSSIPKSIQNPAQTLNVNVVGTANLLKALSVSSFRGRFLYVSSADVYGAILNDELPVTEAKIPAPRNPYASSKVGAEVLCQQWQRSSGMDLIIARPFNHTGPGQTEHFALSGFAKKLAELKLQGRHHAQLEVGNLSVTRDILDVKDVIDAYFMLLELGESGETYNICSGVETKLQDAVEKLADIAGMSVDFEIDPQRLRPFEQMRVKGCGMKIANQIGWKPKVSIEDTLKSVFDYWMKELSK